MTQKEKGHKAPTNTTENKYSYIRAQRQAVFKYFSEHTTTMYQCERDTGICRPNICRHIANLETADRIIRLKKDICPISGRMAHYFKSKTNV